MSFKTKKILIKISNTNICFQQFTPVFAFTSSKVGNVF